MAVSPRRKTPEPLELVAADGPKAADSSRHILRSTRCALPVAGLLNGRSPVGRGHHLQRLSLEVADSPGIPTTQSLDA